jgi:2-hydroxymuconate-semialdehyde hydrolase
MSEAQVEIKQERLEHDGWRTHYRLAGHGYPVVLLHGAGGDSSLFDGAIASLMVSYRLIAPDILGHGKTRGPAGFYAVAGYRRWLKSFIEALHTGPVDIIGHSMGGAIALRFTAEHPRLVRRLILVDSIALGMPSLVTTLLLLAAVFNPDDRRALDQVARAVLASPQAISSDVRAALESGGIPKGLRGFAWMYARTWRVMLPVSGWTLSRIQAPVMMLWGENDRYFPAAHAERRMRRLPDARLQRIPNAGHLPFLEQPHAFEAAVRSFL